jgi:nucleoside-diphosphate-sugar epimerase
MTESLNTVLGATGFVGSHLVRYFKSNDMAVWAPSRGDLSLFDRELGDVYYCIGMTSDFREHPFETVESHVSFLAKVLRDANFDRLIYLSSTRIYSVDGGTSEDAFLNVRPRPMSDLYNLSKLLGESLCFNTHRSGIKVVRMSNVYGPDFSSRNFLASLIFEGLERRYIELGTTADSGKDYIHVADVVPLLVKILRFGNYDLYNLASGRNVSNGVLAAAVADALGGIPWSVRQEALPFDFPNIDVRRLSAEFDFHPRSVISDIAELCAIYAESIQ